MNQIKHQIGPKVTSKLQLTDVMFAKARKVRQRKAASHFRRAMRQIAGSRNCSHDAAKANDTAGDHL